jgi:hypothetical protein
MMNKQLWAALCTAAALTLAACGPGVTGTGTGAAVGLSTFNATEQAVCGAPFAANIGCITTTGSAAPSPLSGPAYFESGSGAALVRAVFDANGLALTAPCTGFKFDSVWGRSAALGDRFYGAQERDNGATLLAATATVAADGGGLRITVQDAQAQTLLGPVVLQRQTTAPGAAVCS